MTYREWYEQVHSRDNPQGDSYGSIQWKGTDVCIDLYCKCGAHLHYDGDFLYGFRCPHCNRSYATGRNIALIELSPEEIEHQMVFKEVQPDEEKELTDEQ